MATNASGASGAVVIEQSARRGHRWLKRLGLYGGIALAGDLLLVLINHGDDLARGEVSGQVLLVAGVGFIALLAACYASPPGRPGS